MRGCPGARASMEWSRYLIDFLRSFQRAWLGSILSLTNSPARIVSDHELVSRFLFHRTDFSIEKRRVNPRALMPRSDGKTSVFRILGLRGRRIWQIGDIFVRPHRGKPAPARADLQAGNVSRIGLRLEPGRWPPRHADIAGWPPEKHAKMSLVQRPRSCPVRSPRSLTA